MTVVTFIDSSPAIYLLVLILGNMSNKLSWAPDSVFSGRKGLGK